MLRNSPCWQSAALLLSVYSHNNVLHTMENAGMSLCMIHSLEEKVFIFMRKKPFKHRKFKG